MNTLSKTDGVQQVRCKFFSLTLAELVAASNVIDVALPAGAIVVAGSFNPTTAFDGGTTDTLAFGDSESATRYKSATTAKSTGLVALVPTGYEVTGAETSALRITRATTGTAATVGEVDVCIQYIVRGLSTSNQD